MSSFSVCKKIVFALYLLLLCSCEVVNNNGGSGSASGGGSVGSSAGGLVEVKLSDIPVARIHLNNSAGWCTGTLVAEKIVLTAAHCFENSGGKVVTPSGVVFLEKTGKWSATYDVANFSANNIEIYKDIAWIEIKSAPTLLSAPVAVANNHLALADGSELQHYGASSGKWFKLLKVKYEDNLGLGLTPAQQTESKDWMISAGYDHEASTTGGNSGGPLLIKQDGVWLLLGVLQGESLFASHSGAIAACGFTAIEPFLAKIKADTGVDLQTVNIK